MVAGKGRGHPGRDPGWTSPSFSCPLPGAPPQHAMGVRIPRRTGRRPPGRRRRAPPVPRPPGQAPPLIPTWRHLSLPRAPWVRLMGHGPWAGRGPGGTRSADPVQGPAPFLPQGGGGGFQPSSHPACCIFFQYLPASTLINTRLMREFDRVWMREGVSQPPFPARIPKHFCSRAFFSGIVATPVPGPRGGGHPRGDGAA